MKKKERRWDTCAPHIGLLFTGKIHASIDDLKTLCGLSTDGMFWERDCTEKYISCKNCKRVIKSNKMGDKYGRRN